MSEMGYPAVRARFGRAQRPSSSSGMPLQMLDTVREAPSSVSLVDEQQPLRDSHSHRAPHLAGSRAPIPRQRNGSSGDNGDTARGPREEGEEEEAAAGEEEEQQQPLSPPHSWAPARQGEGRAQAPLLRPQWKPRPQPRP